MAWLHGAADYGASAAAGGGGPAAWLWLLPVVLPLVMAVLAGPVATACGLSEEKRARFYGWWAGGACLVTCGLLLWFWGGGLTQGTIELAGFVGFGLQITVSPANLLFCSLAAWLWAMAALFSQGYLAKGYSHFRYYFYLLVCLTGTLGTFLAGDLFTLFVFFEMVSLGAYPLIAHEEQGEAMSAGLLYLYISVAGGLCLLFGSMLVMSISGQTTLDPSAFGAATSGAWVIAAALLIVGFAIKAGLFPVHLWLPRAHPVAPSPASALLSGVMIKTGAWGIFQVVRVFGEAPPGAVAGAASLGSLVAGFLVPLAMVTMVLGAVSALFVTNAKRVLAYSSVSQIGYIVLGAALAGLLGPGEAMGTAGFAYHVLAHALFKATLFILVGVVYLKTHELDIRRLGSLGRRLPVIAVVFGLAVLGIAGLPGFSGFPSKTTLHDAILIMRKYSPGGWWTLVEAVFTLTGALTVAYMSKLWYFIFVRRPDHRPAAAPATIRETFADRALAIALALPLLVIGLMPQRVLTGLVLPFASAMGHGHEALHHIAHLSYFAWSPLIAALVPILAGIGLLALLAKTGFPGPLPAGLPSIESHVVGPLLRLLKGAVQLGANLDVAIDQAYLRLVRLGESLARLVGLADRAVDQGVTGTAQGGASLARALTAADRMVDEGISKTAHAGAKVAKLLTSVDGGLEKGVAGSAKAAAGLARELTRADEALNQGYRQVSEQAVLLAQAVAEGQGGGDNATAPSRAAVDRDDARGQRLPAAPTILWSVRSLNTATLLLAGMVALLLVVFFLWPQPGPF